jgi:RecA-family ATPase
MTTSAGGHFTPPEERTPGVLQIEWAEEIEPHLNSLWLIKKTLPQQGLALIYGHPGSGKSFLAIDLAMHIALGLDWNGLRTRKGVVVYVAAEGQMGLRNRIVAFRRHRCITGPIPLALISTPIDLYDSAADQAALSDAVREAATRYAEQPALIVIDTISKTLGAGKENTDDLAVYVANCGLLASAFGCCVLPVHHRPKDSESTDPRGHGSLKGGVDTVILVEGGKTEACTNHEAEG